MSSLKLMLTGDVMTGRGIDQILPHPCDPVLYEDYVKSALGYVALAEDASGPIPRRVPFTYVWGDSLGEMEKQKPDVRIINLETAITAGGAPEPKGINYRMHPANIGVLKAAGINACVLANNHVLDWGTVGLGETLETLSSAGIAAVGAGRNEAEARAPLVFGLPSGRRVVLFAYGSVDSGIPRSWGARGNTPGVNLLRDFSPKTVLQIGQDVRAVRKTGDVVVASIHWGGNWGYEISDAHRDFAHALIDDAMVDIVHGHSSHHVKGIEIWHGKLVLYGCGDLINDYEGISGYEEFRDDLSLIYFPKVKDGGGALESLEMAPFHMRAFRLEKADAGDAAWLADLLTEQGRQFGTWAELAPDGNLRLGWS